MDDAVARSRPRARPSSTGLDIDLSATSRRVHGAPVRVQGRHRDATSGRTPGRPGDRPAYPKTLADLIEFNEAQSRPRGPLERRCVFEFAEATNGRDAECADIRDGDDAAGPGRRSTSSWPTTTSTRSSALTNGPAWLTTRPREGDLDGDFSSTSSGSSRPAAISGYADITVPAGYVERAADRDHVHRRPLGRAGAARPRLRLRAGDAGPRPAAVHPDDRRRPLPRRPEPAVQAAQRQQATQAQRDLIVRLR